MSHDGTRGVCSYDKAAACPNYGKCQSMLNMRQTSHCGYQLLENTRK